MLYYGVKFINLKLQKDSSYGTRHTCTENHLRIDIISAVDGLDYADASSRAVKMNVDGLEIKVLSLDDLIINKRSSGRPKDVADALTLEKLREKKKNG